MGKNQHVVKTPSGWGVKGDNNTRATQIFDTQKEAIGKARGIAINLSMQPIFHFSNEFSAVSSIGIDLF